MPNLMLTNWCNNKCAYCFGMDQMSPNVEPHAMTDETFLGILDWLGKCNYKDTIHLMGGEPTLHPKFEWIVENLLERDYAITIFSNLASEHAFEYAQKLAMLPMVNWVVNINSPAHWTPEQKERIEKGLEALGPRASISYNLMPDDDDDDWTIDLINRYNLAKSIKIGFVLPTYTNANKALSDDEYAIVAERVVALAEKSQDHGIRLEYECGIPTCAFTYEQFGRLWRAGSALRSGCCSRLDITPTGKFIYCLPLSTLASKHYAEFENYNEALDWFEKKFAPVRNIGHTFECQSCMLFNPSKCHGGCLAKNLIGVKNLNL